MRFGRRAKNAEADSDSAATREGASPEAGDDAPSSDDPGGQAKGPWDGSSHPHDLSEPGILDFGSLIIKGRAGFGLQLPQDDEAGTIGSVILITETSALELRAFASSRSGGVWEELREEIVQEATRIGGKAEKADGPQGPEVRVQIPAELPNGEPGIRPSRIVGVEGDRWLLRATFMGQEAMEPGSDPLLVEAFHDVVVVRGNEPKPLREPLLISVGEGIELVPMEEARTAADDGSDSTDGPASPDSPTSPS